MKNIIRRFLTTVVGMSLFYGHVAFASTDKECLDVIEGLNAKNQICVGDFIGVVSSRYADLANVPSFGQSINVKRAYSSKIMKLPELEKGQSLTADSMIRIDNGGDGTGILKPLSMIFYEKRFQNETRWVSIAYRTSTDHVTEDRHEDDIAFYDKHYGGLDNYLKHYLENFFDVYRVKQAKIVTSNPYITDPDASPYLLHIPSRLYAGRNWYYAENIVDLGFQDEQISHQESGKALKVGDEIVLKKSIDQLKHPTSDTVGPGKEGTIIYVSPIGNYVVIDTNYAYPKLVNPDNIESLKTP